MKRFSKKLLSIVVAVLLVVAMLCSATFTGYAAAPTYTGDVDNDGSVNAEDLSLVRKALLGETDGWYDINGDGKFNLKDLVRVKIIAVNFEKGEKFEVKYEGGALNNVDTYRLGDLFKLVDGALVDNSKVVVESESETVNAEINKADVWEDTTISFDGTGSVKIHIYEYCSATTLDVVVDYVDKFVSNGDKEISINEDYTLGYFFSQTGDREIDSSKVVFTIKGEEYALTDTADWTNSVVSFDAEGEYELTISENSKPVTVNVTVIIPDKFTVNTLGDVYVGDELTLGQIFGAVEGADIDSSNVTVTVDDEAFVLTDTIDWTQNIVKFTEEKTYTITIVENSVVATASVKVILADKFVAIDTIIDKFIGETVTLGDLFDVKDGQKVNSANVVVKVNDVVKTLENTANWEENVIELTTAGTYTIEISENSKVATATVNVKNLPAAKFETKFTNNYIYRVGNQNAVALGSLFALKEGTLDEDVEATISSTNGSASGVYTANADWTKGTIKFSETGYVTVAIKEASATEEDTCTLELEVVDAMNATSATSAKANNVVLLNDCGLSTLEVSGGYTLYGNGFKLTATGESMYDTMRAGYVTLTNGTLDNVQIICPNFSYSIIYNSQIKDTANTATPADISNNDARGNVRSAIMADGNSKIINSYVHGGRAAIFLRSGNLVVDNSTVSGGAAANIHALSAQSLTLRDATLIQKPFQATIYDTSKTIMGFSGLFECGADGYSTPLILEGTLTQNAWMNETYKQYAPSAASSIVDNALEKTAYLHDLDGDGTKESLNLGFTYIPQDTNGTTKTDNIQDNRTNKSTVPYDTVDVGTVMASAKVYSYKNTNGTDSGFNNNAEYVPSAQGVIVPKLTFTDAADECVFETNFNTDEGNWKSTLTIDLDKGNYNFSFANLLVQKYGKNLTYTVKTGNENVDTSKEIALTSSRVTDYILTVADGDVTHTLYFTLIASKTSIPDPIAADTTGGTPLLVVKSKNNDWSCAIPALEGMKIKYYTVDGEVILDLATLTPSSTGKQNGTNNYWEISKDGYKLKVTCGVIHDTKSVYGMPVVVDNNGTKQMYFTISSTNGYVSTNTAARSVTMTYEFTDPNGKSLTFTKNWNFQYADYKDIAQYSYSDFVNGTMTDLLTSSSGGGGTCIAPETLITLADGSQVRVDSLTGEEQLLVWNLETGKYETAPIVFVDSDEEMEYEIIHLYFSDGSDVKVISEHGFFDIDLGKYVYIDANNYADYVGHKFVTQGDIATDSWNVVTLDKVVIENEVTTAWSPVTFEHLCYYTNGVLSMPGGIEGLFNIFDVDTDTMTYDAEKMQKDIETYGLFTYEDFADLIPEIAFEAFNGDFLKVAMAKGLITWEDIAYLAERYVPLV